MREKRRMRAAYSAVHSTPASDSACPPPHTQAAAVVCTTGAVPNAAYAATAVTAAETTAYAINAGCV